MLKTVADIQTYKNSTNTIGALETRRRINNIGNMIQNKVDMANIPTKRKQIKEINTTKKQTD